MLRRYKEIIFGLLLGLAMWVTDAAMHAQLGEDAHSSGSFADELFRPGSTQFIFRTGFLIIATAFGWALWRSNWRERELRALEEAIIAFNHQLGSPAMRIVSHARMLCGTMCVTRDEMATSLAAAIGDDAQTIDHLAQQYIQFSEQVRAGQTSEAVETLQSIEAWLNQKRTPASGAIAPNAPGSAL
ncbi:MAG: hypothetical protein NVSMB56_05750 [Pyrinomonadaceae bacterium]